MYKETRNKFKLLCRKKKQAYMFMQRTKLMLELPDSKKFWSTYRRLFSVRMSSIPIQPNEWFKYFSNLFALDTTHQEISSPRDRLTNHLNPTDFFSETESDISWDILNGKISQDEIVVAI